MVRFPNLVQSLDAFHSNKSWPFSLVVNVNDVYYRYTPRSDFSVVVNRFPVLILEVCSDPGETDLRRMQMQVACLTRFGNALVSPSSNFLVKAIYINDKFQALEHTFYLKPDRSTPVVHSVYSRMTKTTDCCHRIRSTLPPELTS